MNLCKFGIHRWEEKEGGTLESSVKECKDCGTVIKKSPISTEYHVPEGADSRIVNLDKKLFLFLAGGILGVLYAFLKSRDKE